MRCWGSRSEEYYFYGHRCAVCRAVVRGFACAGGLWIQDFVIPTGASESSCVTRRDLRSEAIYLTGEKLNFLDRLCQLAAAVRFVFPHSGLGDWQQVRLEGSTADTAPYPYVCGTIEWPKTRISYLTSVFVRSSKFVWKQSMECMEKVSPSCF